MYYVPELLSLARKGKLARCWLAGILSEQMFKSKVNNKDIMAVDIAVTCDEILKVLNRNTSNSGHRFSLYLSSKLMCGVVKLYMYQLSLFEKSLSVTLYHLRPMNLDDERKKNKKTTHTDPVLSIDLQIDFTGDLTLPDVPLLTFDDLPSTDVNLLELSPRFVRNPESPTNFPALTDNEADEWMNILTGDNFRQDDAEGQLALPLPTEEGTLPAVRLAPDASASVFVSSITKRAGQKRSSSGGDNNTSAKRPRIHEESDEPIYEPLQRSIQLEPNQLSLAPIYEPLQRTIQVEPNQLSLAPIAELLQQSTQLEPNQLSSAPISEPLQRLTQLEPSQLSHAPIHEVQEETILTEPADFNVLRQAKKKRRGKTRPHRIDENTKISEALKRRNAADVEAYTVPQSVTTAVAENGRAVPLSAILQCPSMTFEFGTNRPPFARQKTFSVDLLDRFEVARSNSFAEATGYSEILEHIRKKHATIESMSSRFRNRTGPEVSSQDDSTPKTMNVVSARSVDDSSTRDETGLQEDRAAQLPLIETTDERIVENISETRVTRNEEWLVSNMQPEREDEAQVAELNDEQPAVIMPDENGDANHRFQESVADSSRPDVVLPPALGGKARVTTTSRDERITEVDDEIASSTSSDRQSDEAETKWTKQNLIECLSYEWRDRSDVPFKKLNPPGEKKVDAAACFSFLLELRMEKKVYLKQRDQVYIEKAGSSESGNNIDG